MRDTPKKEARGTAIYWINHVRPTLTCGANGCVSASSQCQECFNDERLIRNNERRLMRTGLLEAMGLRTRHDDVKLGDLT